MYYFASDVHLGLDCGGEHGNARHRERIFVAWLDQAAANAKGIFLVGDLFDFWFEYKRVIPKGCARVLGKLCELTDRGIDIHLFTGNHDMWAFSYLQDECGVILHHKEEVVELYGKQIFIAHGDNLANKPPLVRVMNAGFRSPTVQWIFSHLMHPNTALMFGQWWSGSSRKAKSIKHTFRAENEPLVGFSRNFAKSRHIDYFVFGHIHCAENYDIGGGMRAVFLGEWIENPVYGVLSEDGEIELKNV